MPLKLNAKQLRKMLPGGVLIPADLVKAHKYGAKKTAVGGVTFDSAAEARRWSALVVLQAAGRISQLRRQVSIELVPGVKVAGEKRARPAIRLIVDFAYIEAGTQVYEDVKGAATEKLPAFRLKCHLAKALHNIDVRVVH